MRLRFSIITFCFHNCLLMPQLALAHGDLDEQIVKVTEELKQNPNEASLYLKRGQLYRYHRAWSKALDDYSHAAELAPERIEIDLIQGSMMGEAGWYDKAKAPLDRFLTLYPKHPEALLARARVLVHLGENIAAAADYTAAISVLERPRPEHYIERAQALCSEGDTYFDEALSGLNRGVERLGSIVTVQLCAIDLEVKMRRYDSALKRVDQIAARSPRKERWLLRRGEILIQAGHYEEGYTTLVTALKAIKTLPQHHRKTRSVQQIEERIASVINSLPIAKKGR